MIPRWASDNEFILSYYRKPAPSVIAAVKSMFYLHNEWFNIWSHVFGLMIILFLGKVALDELQANQFYGEKNAWLAFLASSLVCMSSSICYHLFRQHSSQVFHITIVVDYIGIAFLILGSFTSIMYYSFFCEPYYIKLYIGIMTALCTITGCIVTHPYFNVDELRPLRFGVFFTVCAFTLVPYTHLYYNYLYHQGVWLDLHSYVWAENIVYTIGGLFFATRFPEKYTTLQGKYDLFFASHNIWHICVLGGLVIHLFGLFDAVSRSRAHEAGYQCEFPVLLYSD